MNAKHIFLWICLLVSFISPAHAKEMPLYGTETWLDSGEKAMQQASGRALMQVLVKLSGDPEFSAHFSINELGVQPEAWVESYRYIDSPNPDDSRQWLWVQFNPQALNHYLKKAGVVPWTTPRPKTLLWFVLDHDGKQQILSKESSKAFSTQVARLMSLRGLRFIYPLLDKEDQTFVDSGQLWQLNVPDITSASNRYKVAQTSVVKVVYQRYDRQWHADVMQLSDAGPKRVKISDAMLSHLLVKIADQLLSQTYASASLIDLVKEETEGIIQLTHVSSADDYRHVIDWLHQKDHVEKVTLLAVSPTSVTLKLRLLGSASHFFRQLMALSHLGYQNHNQTIGNKRVWQFSWQQHHHKRNAHA